MSNQVQEVSIPAGTRVRIGVPADRPEQAINALVKLFAETDVVLSARLGLLEVLLPGGKSDFSYSVGIEATSDQESVHRKALDVLLAVPSGRWPIAVVPVTAQYFTDEAIVFYRKPQRKQNWWSQLFGGK